MGVLNLSQPNVAPKSHSLEGLLGIAAQLAHPYIAEQLKKEQSDKAQQGLSEMLNPARDVTTPSDVVESQNAAQKIADQQKGIDATANTPLTDLLAQSKVPSQTTAPELGKMLTPPAPVPLQTQATDVMPADKTVSAPPKPGDPDYINVPKGMPADDYGMVMQKHLTPTLNQQNALAVQRGEKTYEQGMADSKQTGIQMMKDAQGNIVGVPKKAGMSGIQGYTKPATEQMTPLAVMVRGWREENPNITAQEIAQRTKDFQLTTGRPAQQAIAGTGIVFDRRTGQFSKDGMPVTSEDVKSQGIDIKQLSAEAQQRGGSVAANYNTANDLYQKNLPAAIDLRHKVAMKDLLPDSKFKSINEIKQWALQETSDPDLNELKGKLMLMADNLQRTIGGTQGGEWAYKVASTLLDPSLSSEAFERRMNSHGVDISTLAKSRRQFGTNEVSTPETGVQVRPNTLPSRGAPVPPAQTAAPQPMATAPTGTTVPSVNLFDTPIERKRR